MFHIAKISFHLPINTLKNGFKKMFAFVYLFPSLISAKKYKFLTYIGRFWLCFFLNNVLFSVVNIKNVGKIRID